MTLALAILCATIWIGLIFFHGRFWQAGPILRPADTNRMRMDIAPDVTVVVPARNEAESIQPALSSLLAQDYMGRLSVVLVNDRSTDATGKLARALPDPHARLTVVDGADPSAGWSGKLWAVAQGVAEAERQCADGSGYMLFTDADIIHAPAHVSTLVAKAQTDRLHMVSEMVELQCESLAERALVPAFVFFFTLLYPFAKVNNPKDKTAGAAGGTILLRRDMLRQIGGIEALRGALIDDCTLASCVKQAGGRLYLGHSCLAKSIRPYPTAGDIWRMIARTAYVQLRFSPALLILTVLAMIVVWIAPLALTFLAHGPAQWVGAATLIVSLCAFVPTLLRFRLSPLWALALPFIALFYTAATIGSALNHHRGKGVVWKDRAYTEAIPNDGRAMEQKSRRA
ncbi:glycosyl transferase [Acetobacter pomorum]|uniref:Glycosyl transferase n=1 Tax=Acetobacter pomorum TaxID=65959 RepID=A0A2G4RB62_9PROT|nr:glycosyltransferase [Acetobacter pomorum]PHY93793.1 glycosyl transferase [Acetobacter pomorum]GBR54842.1 glycosyltransferase [Acetobacter pomorum DSM 11825]